MPVWQSRKCEYRTYYIVFQNSVCHRPWHFLTWNNFHHCWVFFAKYKGPIGLLTHQGTIKVEHLTTFLDVDYWEAEPEEVVKEFIKEDHVLDIVKISLLLPQKYNIRGLINCVTLVKAVTGLCKWFVITPQQLHRHLLRVGGESLKKEIT